MHVHVLVTLSIAGVHWHDASGRELAPSKLQASVDTLKFKFVLKENTPWVITFRILSAFWKHSADKKNAGVSISKNLKNDI